MNPLSTKNGAVDYGTSSRDKVPAGDEKEREPEVIGFPSCRQILYVMMFFGAAMAYALRISLNEAIVAMVNHTAVRSHLDNISYENECPRDPTLERLGGEFNWDRRQQGILLASFYYGYILTQVLGGWIADRIGGKLLFGGGILGTAVLTLFTPAAARLHFVAVVALRAGEGVLEGFMIPATHGMLSRWTEESHTTRGVTISFSGQEFGVILGMLLGGVLSDHGFAGGWPSVFYVFGALGCIWSVAWFLLCYDAPSTHPRISAVERRRLEAVVGPASRVDASAEQRKTTPWRGIFTSGPLLACCVGKFAHDWGYHTVINGLPLFFFDVLGFSMTDNGLLASVPFLVAMCVIAIMGHVADWLRGPGRLSTTSVRKVFCICGLVFPSIFFVVSGFLGCDRVPVVLTMVAAMVGVACAWSCFAVNPLDLSRNHAATLFGIANSAGTLAAMGAPHVIGELTHRSPTRTQWRKVFLVTAVLEWLGTFVYMTFGSGDQQSWDVENEEKTT